MQDRKIYVVPRLILIILILALSEQVGFGEPSSIQNVPIGMVSSDEGTEKNNKAEALCAAGEYVQAERLFKEALVYWDKHTPLDPHARPSCLNNLGLLYAQEKKYGEAEAMYKEAIAVSEACLSKEDKLLALTLDNFAQTCRLQGKLDIAEPLYKRSLAIEEKCCAGSQDNAITEFNLALLYFEQGKSNLSKPLMEKSLAILKSTLGENHPDYQCVYRQYISLLNKMNNTKNTSGK